MFGQDRTQLRRFYQSAWRKRHNGEAMEPLEQMVAEVIGEHPEYLVVIEAGEDALDRDYLPEAGESNPFLHMGMHIAIREQLAVDRPAGIRQAYRDALQSLGDAHEVEHRVMGCLGEMLWQAQSNGTTPDEAAYLACVQRLSRQ